MAPIVKDSETAIGVTTSASSTLPSAKSVADAGAHPQPVALEVPVTINGARTIEGSDKREPFAESTQTVLVFPQGAVVRLASPLAPGQLVFLTNEKTKKEVVCQVVKSKNYRTVTGYVELEFTEPAAGFWGMRFPASVAAPSAGAPAPPRPVAPPVVAPKISAPVAPTSVKPVVPPTQNVTPAKPAVLTVPATKPHAPTTSAPPKSVTAPPAPAKPAVVPPAPKPQLPTMAALPTAPPPSAAKINAQPQLPASPSTIAVPSSAAPVIPDLSEFLASSASSPAPTKTETPTQASAASTEELKLQAAKLQQQLSAMLFSGASKAQTAVPTLPSAGPEKLAAIEASSKVLELADLAPTPAKIPLPAAPVSKVTPIAQKPVASSFEAEEVKIPAWLAPLANNSEPKSSASTPLQESPTHTEPAASETMHEETSGFPSSDNSHSIQAEMFGGQLLSGSGSVRSEAPSKSKKGLLIGVAAGLLIAGGTVWYTKQPGNILTARAAVAPAPAPAASTTPFAASESAAKPQSSASPNVASNSANAASPSLTPPLTPAKQTTLSEANTSVSANALTPAASKQPSEKTRSFSPAPAVPEAKKPVVGDVQLAKPVVNGRTGIRENGEGSPSIEVNQPANGETLTSLAGSHAKGPTAPLPVGGDVKQAHLLKSVPPIYPAMAKSQRVSGDVKIDALIDASGNVSAMKILSGPTMLHQAALVAVKQWRYQPAELDGSATSMHLTVTVQFRLQ